MYRNFWRCNVTIQEMLIARGYDSKGDIEDNQIDHSSMIGSYEQFTKDIQRLCEDENEGEGLNQKVLDKLTYLRQHLFTGEWIYIFFVLGRIGVNLVETYAECMSDSGVSRSIMISVPNDNKMMLGDSSVLTPFALKRIKTYNVDDGKIIEHFYLSELTVNKLQHELQPKEIKVLTAEEIQDNLDMHNAGLLNFSRISPSDTLSRFLGLQIGDMIKCVCNSETAGEYIRYRVCYKAM